MMAKEPDSGDLPKALKILRDISCRAEKGESETHWDLVRQGHVLAEALSSAAAEERDAEAAAALPDLAAAVFRGEAAMVNEVFSAVAKAVAAALSPRSQTSMAVRTRLLERFCSRYISEKDVLADLVKRLVEEGICVEEELLSLGGGRQRTAVIKAMVAGSGSARQLESVMGSISPSRCQQDFRSVLFSPFCIPDDVSSRLCSYLGSCLPGADLVGLLKQSLRLWGDPVIARAHVSREVIRYSKLVLLLLSHTPVEDLSKVQSGLVGLLARGLPNHFSSSDGRTVELAKTIGEILTETFKRISGEENVSDVPDGLLRPQNELCQQLLDLVHSGKASEDFWMNKLPKEDLSVPVASSLSKVTINEDESKPSAEVDSDDDDDSDLEPIESLEPPPESKVRYLRDFLEGLPEMKDHSDAERAFRELPAVARRQLEHEHSAVGKELMEAVFLWENEFNDPVLDTHRRNSLTAVVSTRPSEYLRPFCLLFHRDQVQPYRKNVVLQVLGDVAEKVDLKDLQVLARTVFSSLLLHEGTVAEQDVTVRIPLILFLSQTIRMLPSQMVTEDMLLSFLGSVRNLRLLDGATEQTVCYALSGVVGALGGAAMTPRVRGEVADAREWMLAMQIAR